MKNSIEALDRKHKKDNKHGINNETLSKHLKEWFT